MLNFQFSSGGETTKTQSALRDTKKNVFISQNIRRFKRRSADLENRID